MKKSPVFRALGGSVLAFGLVLTAVPAASAAPASAAPAAPAAPAATQAEALERDLGLSSTEAAEITAKQENAVKVEEELRASLGDDFGGSVFDVQTGKLTVSVTDESAAAEVREAGATPRVVEFGEKELDSIVSDLNSEETTADAAVTGWYTDAAADAVVITVEKGQEAAAEELVAAAGVSADAVQIKETTEEPRTYADIIGGNKNSLNAAGTSYCSVGFAVQGGFATAGHCGSVGATSYSPAGTFAGSIFPSRDMGWVRTTSAWVPRPYVNNYSGGTVTVRGSQEAAIGASVCRSGATTGWRCGVIQSKNQTVRYAQGAVYGLTRTTACAEPGDSGGSWLSGNQAQGVTSGGSGNCRTGGTTYFQPINPILSQWGLTLVTG